MLSLLGASGGEGGGGNEETANSQALSDLQSEIRELRKKLETLEEEKQKALEKAREAEREMNKLRRPGLMDKIKQLFRK